MLELQTWMHCSVEQANREAGYLEYRGSMAARQAKTQALGNLVMSVAQVGMSGALMD